jgi:hypothetical protein
MNSHYIKNGILILHSAFFKVFGIPNTVIMAIIQGLYNAVFLPFGVFLIPQISLQDTESRLSEKYNG